VTNATTLEPVPQATVRVVGSGELEEVTSESDGSFLLRLPAGVYDLLVEADDFAPTRFERVRVRGGLTTTRNLPLESRGYRLAGFIVTASRGAVDTETEITAPSSSHSVRNAEIDERPTPALVDHLRESPGVDIGTLGLQASNIVARGFNNIFSGALHLLTDYRLAGLPGLRVNYLHFLPLSDSDIERVEVVLGPGSALYGPNTANGVVHLITKSPLESQGTAVSLGAGERSIVQGTFRSAFAVTDDFAVKFSGHILRGQEWPHVDSTELAARTKAQENPQGCIDDLELRGLPAAEAEVSCLRVGERDFGVRRYGMEARADWRYSPKGTLVGTYGANAASGIELTGLGATQIEHWIHQFVQGRFTYDRWAIQAYFNFNDSGEAYQLRTGMPLVDQSNMGVLQIQNGFSIADGRQDFTYGWDYFSTRPRTEGTIYGNFEGDNDIHESGYYLQSRTSLAPRVDLVAAGRIDAHSILPDGVFSSRLAVVAQPDSANALRFSYNRAFSTPSALNYFLDLAAGPAPAPLGELGFRTRAFGSGRAGFAWQNADGTLLGMRSPFNPGGSWKLLDVHPATLWSMGLEAVNRAAPLPAGALRVLTSLAPGLSDIDILYQDTNRRGEKPLPLSTLVLPDVEPVREGITETFEVGWTGVLNSTVRVSADVYHMTRHDFVSPLVVETPLLYLDGDDIQQWLSGTYVQARTDDLMQREGLGREEAEARAAQEAGHLIPALATGIGGIPLGVVASDVAQMEGGGADLIATYRNVGDLSIWGADVAVQWLLSPKWSLGATYSHVSRDWFRIEGSPPLALNAPTNKGTLSIAYRDEGSGLSASARARYHGSFPFLSTEFDGTRCMPDSSTDNPEDCIAAQALADATVGYRLRRTGATLQLGVSNLLNSSYRSFVGAPQTGRLAMVRVRYDF
jgi:iron complex outermembrane receptor protein